eukprot:841875-Alexandrium_andersonii.AAC.1
MSASLVGSEMCIRDRRSGMQSRPVPPSLCPGLASASTKRNAPHEAAANASLATHPSSVGATAKQPRG